MKDPWQKALDALSRRSLSCSELRAKLRAAGYGAREVDGVLEKAERLRLVDDRAVAYNHARHREAEGRRGPLRVRSELQRRGLDPMLVDEVIAEVFPADQAEEFFRRALARLGPAAERSRGREREKIARKLARAGFARSLVAGWLGQGRGAWEMDEPREDDAEDG